MPPARRAAFSLVELMIALGVLAIGIAMVAGLFPAAIKQTEISYNDAVGTIIAQNGLAMARATLTMGNVTNTNLDIIADDSNLGTGRNVLTALLRAYHDDPAAPTLNDKGFIVLGRRLPTNTNEVQLVIVAYAKKDPAANVTAKPISLTNIDHFRVNVTPNNIANARRLSPLIMADAAGDGRHATIEQVNIDNLLLDHEALHNNPSVNAWVVVEAGQNGVSPAMAVVSATVALPQ
jgi:prepilin-type N-terminal cleavage/methylation domain-containing protein